MRKKFARFSFMARCLRKGGKSSCDFHLQHIIWVKVGKVRVIFIYGTSFKKRQDKLTRILFTAHCLKKCRKSSGTRFSLRAHCLRKCWKNLHDFLFTAHCSKNCGKSSRDFHVRHVVWEKVEKAHAIFIYCTLFETAHCLRKDGKSLGDFICGTLFEKMRKNIYGFHLQHYPKVFALNM